jgi:hypothetical protein
MQPKRTPHASSSSPAANAEPAPPAAEVSRRGRVVVGVRPTPVNACDRQTDRVRSPPRLVQYFLESYASTVSTTW